MTTTYASENTVDGAGNLFTRNGPFDVWQFVRAATPAEIAAYSPEVLAAAAAAPLGAPAPVVEPEPVVVAVDVESRLDQLLAQYELAKAEAKKADEALKAITDGIKAELIAAAPNATTIDVESKHLTRSLRLKAITAVSVDSARLKAEQPLVHAQYSKSNTSWRLAAVG